MRNHFILKILVLFTMNSVTMASSFFTTDNNISLSGAVGYAQFHKFSDETLTISDYVTDLLTHSHQKNQIACNVSAKKQFAMKSPHVIDKIMLGPAFYFNKNHYSGEVWELLNSEFYNYQYRLKSNNVHFLLESDFYFKPIVKHLTPFFTLGGGMGVAYMDYDDYALPGIPQNSEQHQSAVKTKGIYSVGAGFAVPINSHLAVNLRYNYIHMGQGRIAVSAFDSLTMNLNNQNVLIGIRVNSNDSL